MGRSWAADAAERDAWIAFAQQMCGVNLASVRYLDIDYRRFDLTPNATGVRHIVDEAEWREPTFQFPGGDTVDFGVELGFGDGRVFSVTWESPGMTEGIALFDHGLWPDVVSDAAAWDVSSREPWSRFMGQSIDVVKAHYEPWDDAGAWWCCRVDLKFGAGSVELLLAQGNPDGTIGPSADNIVVRTAV